MAKMRKPQNVQKSSKGSIRAIRRLRRHLDFLSLLCKAKTAKQRHIVLQTASVEHVRTVCECIKNVMQKKVPDITEKDKKIFRKYGNAIKKIDFQWHTYAQQVKNSGSWGWVPTKCIGTHPGNCNKCKWFSSEWTSYEYEGNSIGFGPVVPLPKSPFLKSTVTVNMSMKIMMKMSSRKNGTWLNRIQLHWSEW